MYSREHHNLIYSALDNFNSDYLTEHQILFGGGTRIALELNEYRKSIDIDFLCPNKDSYRAVRTTASNNSLGNLVKKDFEYPREIRLDRDSTRCFILIDGVTIKLEFVSFADYSLNQDKNNNFHVPAIDHDACYLTKLLANADRYNDEPYKDIFDLLAMFENWGEINTEVWKASDTHYSYNSVFSGLEKACAKIIQNTQKYLEIAQNELEITSEYSEKLVNDVSKQFMNYVLAQKSLHIR
ncbi:nucleotidyl transferase AbiEii/AbiGii toxin family protein [Acinetobacter pittii]|uniref:nucleotidyl transferase AbiEii/AbiGii toxin family protein n=1 Tax=Acinetobacter pittii TaxID=48296 RepID=UPI00355B986B